MAKSQAGKILEQYAKLNSKSLREDGSEAEKLDKDGKPMPAKSENEQPIGKDKDGKPLGVDGKAAPANGQSQEVVDPKSVVKNEDGTLNDMGELPMEPMKKVKEAFSGDPKKSSDAVAAIKELSESKHPMAKKFMEALDDMTSAVDVKKMKDGKDVNEDADGEYLAVFEPQKWAHLSEKYSMKKK